jgi:hypothetical protein
MFNELAKGLEKLASLKPGAGKHEQTGNEYFRVEHSGQAERKILHVELEVPPTSAQEAQLADLKEAGKSFEKFGPGEEIEIVVSWPGAQKPVFGVPLGKVSTGVSLGLMGAGMYARNERREHQYKTEGYDPAGLAAHQSDSLAHRVGAFFRGDQAEMVTGAKGSLNMPVWRGNFRSTAGAKKPGETLTINWQYKDIRDSKSFLQDVPIVYQKLPDGSWQSMPVEAPPDGFRIPNLNKIVDPQVSDSEVLDMISMEKGA